MTVSAPLSGMTARPGFCPGWSQPRPTPRDARQLVDNLGPASFDRAEISLQVGHEDLDACGGRGRRNVQPTGRGTAAKP